MSRPRGFLRGWKPQAKTTAVISAIQAVLDEYSEQLPLTLRQVFYRLVAQGVIGKTETDYKRLCEVANKARRAQVLRFQDIRDDGFTFRAPSALAGVDDFWSTVEAYAETFQLDRQDGQETRLMVWCEAAGMVPQLQRVAAPYGIPVLSSGGFDSVTSKYEMAVEMAGMGRVEVLHIGDHDPSGVHIFSSLAEDITAFTYSYGGETDFFRLAVVPDQIEAFGLPTAPPKPTDNRSFSGETCQAEAIPPDQLADILRGAIDERLDRDAYQLILRRESEARRTIVQSLKAAR